MLFVWKEATSGSRLHKSIPIYGRAYCLGSRYDDLGRFDFAIISHKSWQYNIGSIAVRPRSVGKHFTTILIDKFICFYSRWSWTGWKCHARRPRRQQTRQRSYKTRFDVSTTKTTMVYGMVLVYGYDDGRHAMQLFQCLWLWLGFSNWRREQINKRYDLIGFELKALLAKENVCGMCFCFVTWEPSIYLVMSST